MPFSPNTKSLLRNKLEEYEDRINHLYIDINGNVTVGIGHLIINKNAMSGVTLYKVQNDKLTGPATLQEKMTEFENIKKLPYGQNYTAGYYKQHTSLIMKDSDIDFLKNNHIDTFYQELKTTYKKENGFLANFDDFEPNLQLALFDMVFNLGTPTLKNNFPKFNTALKSDDYTTAANESHRKGISEERNNYVKNLLLTLATEKEI